MSTIGNEAVAKNAEAEVGVRRRIRLHEGANVTLTVADDPANHEIDVTIASAGAAAVAWLDQFFPAVDPDSYKGTYAAIQLTDDQDVTVRQTIMIPSSIVTIDTGAVVLIPSGTGNIRRSVATNFGEVCAGEGYQHQTDGIAAGEVAVTDGDIECIDITIALTLATGGDLVGVEFTREASNALDTVNAAVHYIGILIRGSV